MGNDFKIRIPTSPAFVIDEKTVLFALEALALMRKYCGCNILYSIKSLPLCAILELAKPFVDGFSVSSLFEARLANEALVATHGGIHLTTPGVRPDEITELASLCTHINCNSIGQLQRFLSTGINSASPGLRINPQLSFSEDVRHDPCRKFSKLGVTINDLLDSDSLNNINGLHFHTVFNATGYKSLIKTLALLQNRLGNKLSNLDWLNIGGGYLYGQIAENGQFYDLVGELKDTYGLDIFIEPGHAVVGEAGYLLSSVIDYFESDGKNIAVLDTSVNHHPQVFEYQRQPELVEHDPQGIYPVLLAGSTCLAGDLFGEYRFNQPLRIGDSVVFKNVGAYSLVKANRFNGYNLPDVYLVNDGQVKLVKHFTYQDYKQQWISDF